MNTHDLTIPGILTTIMFILLTLLAGTFLTKSLIKQAIPKALLRKKADAVAKCGEEYKRGIDLQILFCEGDIYGWGYTAVIFVTIDVICYFFFFH